MFFVVVAFTINQQGQTCQTKCFSKLGQSAQKCSKCNSATTISLLDKRQSPVCCRHVPQAEPRPAENYHCQNVANIPPVLGDQLVLAPGLGPSQLAFLRLGVRHSKFPCHKNSTWGRLLKCIKLTEL